MRQPPPWPQSEPADQDVVAVWPGTGPWAGKVVAVRDRRRAVIECRSMKGTLLLMMVNKRFTRHRLSSPGLPLPPLSIAPGPCRARCGHDAACPCWAPILSNL